MNNRLEPSKKYLQTLLKYYEEEISGEAYFYALAEHFAGREKTILLARIERRAAEAVRPLLEKYGLTPRDESTCHSEGKSHLISSSDILVMSKISGHWNRWLQSKT